MPDIAYVNGEYVAHQFAKISIDDRGLQFGDAVYEVWAVKNGNLLDKEGHFTRLWRSLKEMRINYLISPKSLEFILKEIISRNRLKNGIVYLQISRGTALRDHPFPKVSLANTIITARSKDFAALENRAQIGIKVKTQKDNRWGRVDIKTTNLLPNVLAKQNALDEGFDDVWFVDNDGFVTEGSAQNAWIITKEHEFITRDISNAILSGITRKSVAAIIKSQNLNLIERKFTIQEALDAKEAFVTSATSFVTPVTSIDGATIGNGVPGEFARKLRLEYLR